ncbi:MAG: hypothetical protein LBI34_00600 [Puniceicoccales bacterium]|jgi:hypothetical protein|nr:hypothetical protein [Puniceicoccales bacterium]
MERSISALGEVRNEGWEINLSKGEELDSFDLIFKIKSMPNVESFTALNIFLQNALGEANQQGKKLIIFFEENGFYLFMLQISIMCAYCPIREQSQCLQGLRDKLSLFHETRLFGRVDKDSRLTDAYELEYGNPANTDLLAISEMWQRSDPDFADSLPTYFDYDPVSNSLLIGALGSIDVDTITALAEHFRKGPRVVVLAKQINERLASMAYSLMWLHGYFETNESVFGGAGVGFRNSDEYLCLGAWFLHLNSIRSGTWHGPNGVLYRICDITTPPTIPGGQAHNSIRIAKEIAWRLDEEILFKAATAVQLRVDIYAGVLTNYSVNRALRVLKLEGGEVIEISDLQWRESDFRGTAYLWHLRTPFAS